MSPNTQVALISLILFFAVAGISLVWPRLAGLERSRTRLASGGMAYTINAPEWTLPKALAKLQDRPLPPEIQTRARTAVQRSLLERRRESKMPQIAAIRCGRARYG